MKNYEEVIVDFDSFLQMFDGDEIVFNHRGNAKLAIGKAQEALTDFNIAVGINLENPESYRNRGIAKAALKTTKKLSKT